MLIWRRWSRMSRFWVFGTVFCVLCVKVDEKRHQDSASLIEPGRLCLHNSEWSCFDVFGHSAPVLCVVINWEERLDQIFGGRSARERSLEVQTVSVNMS